MVSNESVASRVMYAALCLTKAEFSRVPYSVMPVF